MDQGTSVEATVVQKLNHGTSRKRAVIVFGGPFLVTFLDKQKSDKQTAYWLIFGETLII